MTEFDRHFKDRLASAWKQTIGQDKKQEAFGGLGSDPGERGPFEVLHRSSWDRGAGGTFRTC